MKIFYTAGYRSNAREIGIEEAIEKSIVSNVHGEGSVEVADSRGEACAEMLGKVVAALHKRGALNDADVESLLCSDMSCAG